MPELPEVYTITKDLNAHITGFVIKKVLISKSYSVQPSNEEFINSTLNREVLKVTRIAKNILIQIEKDKYIRIHLAMTGRVLLRDKKDIKDKWVKIILVLKKGNDTRYLKFCDMRMFGKVALLENKDFAELQNKYGPEPIDPKITLAEFSKAIRSKNTNIKNVLLDQNIVSGLGNIYATDALFLAKINPQTKTKDLDDNEIKTLLEASKEILKEGIKNRGSTLPDKMYVDVFGESGSQQNYFKVYMKEKCPVCKTKVEYIKLNSRGTYFCPKCQPHSQNNQRGLFGYENK